MDTMDGWLVTGISLIGSTIITTVVAILIKENFAKFFSKKEEEEKAIREQQERLKSLEIQKEREQRKEDIKEAIEEAVAPIKKDLEVLKKGTQSSLRHDLFLMADEWLAKGYCPRRVKSDFEHLYTQYHLLGKNGVMDNTYQAILALPEIEPERKEAAAKKKVKEINQLETSPVV